MNFYRGTLTASTEEVVKHGSQKVTIFNLGPGAVHIAFDKAATEESLLIPENFGRTFSLGWIVENVHLFSTEETQIQVDGMG